MNHHQKIGLGRVQVKSMPHKNLKINSKAIDRANRVQDQVTQAMRGVQRLDTYEYRDRDHYYGENSPYRYKPNPAYKMPGTSPPDKKRTVADVILEFLKIKPDIDNFIIETIKNKLVSLV